MTGTGNPAAASSWGEQRQPPFHCPYCAEEDLVPPPADAMADGTAGQGGHGAWMCRSCLRIFAVRFLGIGARA